MWWREFLVGRWGAEGESEDEEGKKKKGNVWWGERERVWGEIIKWS